MKSLLIFLIPLSGILYSCQPAATFDQPQPEGKSPLSKIPRRLQGSYLNLKDSSQLSINENTVIQSADVKFTTAKELMDSTHILRGDTIFDLETGEKIPVRHVGDSLMGSYYTVDTILRLPGNGVLKKFKGYYFLSIPYEKMGWEVKKISLTKGRLAISSITNKEEISKLQEIAESKLDTAPFRFNPTKRQFRKFVRHDGFQDREEFVRLR